MSRARLRECGLTLVLLATALAAWGREVSVSLLHTANLNGHVLSVRYRAYDAHHGGMLRVANRIREIRAEADAVVLIDGGGLVKGSPESELSGGLLPLSALARMGYDLRLPSLEEWHPEAAGLDPAGIAGQVPYLAANGAASWAIIERGGLRIGFAGAVDGTPPPGCDPAPAPPDAAIHDALRALRRVSADVLVLLYHGATEDPYAEARTFCRRFPDFHLVLVGGGNGGTRSERIGTTHLTETGASGLWLGRVDLTFDTVQRALTRLSADLVPISADVPECPELRAALGANLGRIRGELDDIIGYTERDIGGDRRWPGQSEMTELVARSVMDQRELVLLARDSRGMLSQGKVTYGDILRAVPRPGPWADLRVRPPELRRILEENAELLSADGFLGATGFSYEADLNAPPGDRIRNVRLETGERPHGRAHLTLRFPASLVQDPALADERPVLRAIAARPESRFSLPGIDTRIRVIKYIRRHSPVTIRPTRTLTLLPDAT